MYIIRWKEDSSYYTGSSVPVWRPLNSETKFFTSIKVALSYMNLNHSYWVSPSIKFVIEYMHPLNLVKG